MAALVFFNAQPILQPSDLDGQVAFGGDALHGHCVAFIYALFAKVEGENVWKG